MNIDIWVTDLKPAGYGKNPIRDNKPLFHDFPYSQFDRMCALEPGTTEATIDEYGRCDAISAFTGITYVAVPVGDYSFNPGPPPEEEEQ